MIDNITNQRASSKRHLAQRLQHAGNYRKAVDVQIELINEQGGYAPERAEDMHLLGLYLFQLGDIVSARNILEKVREFLNNDVDVAKNLAICELKLGHVSKALGVLEVCVAQHPENFELRDVYAHAAGQSGNLNLAQEQGKIALELKHRAVITSNNDSKLSAPAITQPNPTAKNIQVIAFSLWGAQAKYLDGAVRNAHLMPDIYPNWQCRFYVDESVPTVVLEKLRSLGCEIVMQARARHAFDGLFWRFLVADDPQVARFVVRDCDALVNIRERAAVDEWCQSGKSFHVMRDFYSHTELILAGLWVGSAVCCQTWLLR